MLFAAVAPAVLLSAVLPAQRVLVLGGSGRIGTACAAHLLSESSTPLHVVLAGRSSDKCDAALLEVARDSGADPSAISSMQLDWQRDNLAQALQGFDAVVHTAGPFGETPLGLQAAIDANVPAYLDLSDPIGYIEAARALAPEAQDSGTTALICAGAFPGLSNLLAMECAARLAEPVQDVDFSYFTAGLGGSGEVNLYITNEGFGTPVPVFSGGSLQPKLTGGAEPRKVDFFLDAAEPAAALVGERQVSPHSLFCSFATPRVSSLVTRRARLYMYMYLFLGVVVAVSRGVHSRPAAGDLWRELRWDGHRTRPVEHHHGSDGGHCP